MGSMKISEVPLITDPQQIAAALIPASPSDETAAAIQVKDLVKAERIVLGVDSVPEYSDASSYGTGAFVRRSGKMYRITASKSPGAWDAGKAIETTMYNELSRMYGSDTEELTVNVSCSDGSSAEGITVGVALGDGRTLSGAADSEGNVQFTIPRGLNYRVEVSDKDGYQSIPPVSVVSNAVQRTIQLVFYALGSESAYEVVTLVANRQDYGDFTSVSGKTATISCSNGQSYHPVFGDNGRAVQSVPRGLTYTVQWPAVENYLTPADSSAMTAAMSSRYIVSEPYAYIGDTGVFIVDADGQEYDIQSWVASGKTAGAAIHITHADLLGRSDVKRADGSSYGLDFYVSTSIAARNNAWASQNVLFSSLAQCTNQALAVAEKDGLLNTELIISEGASKNLTTPAATWCKEQTLTIGGKTGRAFLGSFGQLWVLKNVYDTFSTALTKAGGAVTVLNVKVGNWWSSVQCSATNSVLLNNGNFYYYSKNLSYQCVPLFAF